MNSIPSQERVDYQPIRLAETLSVILLDAVCRIFVKGELRVQAAVEISQATVQIFWKRCEGLGSLSEEILLMTSVEHLFTHIADAKTLFVRMEQGDSPLNSSELQIDSRFQKGEHGFKIARSEFFQIPLLWHRAEDAPHNPDHWTQTGEVKHPQRPSTSKGIIYRRHIPSLNKDVSFELLDLERHLDVFHEWQNQKRVAHFWELDKPKEELREYLEAVHADAHHIPVIASLDGEPSGYFEVYWTPEDRLGPYYERQDYDRGFHFLIGNKAHLGRKTFNAFVESITHFLFLSDARTQTLLAEPRADNIALLHYLSKFPFWEKRFEFDFPHKRAALLASRREDFFEKASFL